MWRSVKNPTQTYHSLLADCGGAGCVDGDYNLLDGQIDYMDVGIGVQCRGVFSSTSSSKLPVEATLESALAMFDADTLVLPNKFEDSSVEFGVTEKKQKILYKMFQEMQNNVHQMSPEPAREGKQNRVGNLFPLGGLSQRSLCFVSLKTALIDATESWQPLGNNNN
uniref:Uncharacterized protein n=1 Tax=Glossina pallidipes TaxID=7398 RepID=A0A1A9Z1S5_GLOPL